MALTLADHALQSTDPFEKGVVKRFMETSDLMRYAPFKKISGDIYRYRQEDVLPGVSWRRVNEPYPESTGLISPRAESLMILGGDIFVDNFILRTQRQGGDAFDEVAHQYDMKSRAVARAFEEAAFEGDDLVDPDMMPGLRRRLTGNQVILAGSGGATLTLAMIDTLIDAVSTEAGQVHLFMNKTLRRKMTNLVNAIGGSVVVNYGNISEVGRQVQRYNGIPIHVVEDGWDATTFLGFDEDPGDGTQDTASIYAVAFGEDMGVHFIYNGDGPTVEVRRVGETLLSAAPGIVGRIEAYYGMVIKHPRAAARLRGINNA